MSTNIENPIKFTAAPDLLLANKIWKFADPIKGIMADYLVSTGLITDLEGFLDTTEGEARIIDIVPGKKPEGVSQLKALTAFGDVSVTQISGPMMVMPIKDSNGNIQAVQLFRFPLEGDDLGILIGTPPEESNQSGSNLLPGSNLGGDHD